MKKLTNSTKVLRYIRKNPNAKAKEVAKELGVGIASVYQATYNARKKAKSLVVTALAPVNKVPLKREKVDTVNHPPHYKAGGIETIDFIEAKSLNYNLGNVVKYITRADHKGSKLEDLKKSQWYLNREVSNLEKK